LSHKISVLAFAGSTRESSFNKKLVRLAARGAAGAGAKVTEIDLRDYPLPLFDEDLEARDGLHENAARLREMMAAHDGLLISSPEYNSSISAVLKNCIDWVTRTASPEESGLLGFRGKVAGIMSASPGSLGGLRGLVHLRAILGNLGVVVLPEQRAIGQAHSAFADDGSMKDAKNQEAVEAIGARVARVAGQLRGD